MFVILICLVCADKHHQLWPQSKYKNCFSAYRSYIKHLIQFYLISFCCFGLDLLYFTYTIGNAATRMRKTTSGKSLSRNFNTTTTGCISLSGQETMIEMFQIGPAYTHNADFLLCMTLITKFNLFSIQRLTCKRFCYFVILGICCAFNGNKMPVNMDWNIFYACKNLAIWSIFSVGQTSNVTSLYTVHTCVSFIL